MDFALTADQKLMQASLAGVLGRAAPLARVRAFADSDEAVASDVWGALADLGLPGLLAPEEHGGLGLSLLDAALAAEALGAQAAPAPFLGAALACVALRDGGSPAQQSAWLPRIASGEIVVGVAITEAVSGARDGAGVRAADGRLTGTSLFAIDAAGADLLLVADAGRRLHLVEAGAPGLEVRDLRTIDRTRRFAEVALAATPAEALAGGDVIGRLADAAWILIAADTLGAGQAMLDKAVDYAKVRRQFGRLIGSFQAVKHLIAEMAAELEPCRALVWYAAYAYDALPAESALVAAHAKAHLGEVGRFVARTATEVHGGVGFTDLLGLHLWFKRIGVSRQLLGGPERVREHAARLQGLVAA
jgi:alkylation response protein AidB-like acyl-CoA dehydrogenase